MDLSGIEAAPDFPPENSSSAVLHSPPGGCTHNAWSISQTGPMFQRVPWCFGPKDATITSLDVGTLLSGRDVIPYSWELIDSTGTARFTHSSTLEQFSKPSPIASWYWNEFVDGWNSRIILGATWECCFICHIPNHVRTFSPKNVYAKYSEHLPKSTCLLAHIKEKHKSTIQCALSVGKLQVS